MPDMTAPGWPLVSIVFLAYNRREELATSLTEVLERLDYPADRLEVIVVDNASSDGTHAMVRERFPQVQLIRTPRNIGASAWNTGMTTARGEWRMILDDDCYITGDALKTAVRRAQDHDADIVSFRVLSGTTPGYVFNDEYVTGLLTFWGCSAMFSRRVIEAEPFYDPNIFIWANEMELTMRLLDRGYRHLYLPEVESVHMKGPNPRFSERSTRINAKHYAYIAAKALRPLDAAGAVLNLVGHVVLEAYSLDRRALRAVPEIGRGVAMGLRHRAPVRAEVSHVYRRHTWHFSNPLVTLRTPADRLRARRGADVEHVRRQRSERWRDVRREYYPRRTAVLTL
jgi:GT2 family glycosyltransferase